MQSLLYNSPRIGDAKITMVANNLHAVVART